ncbi:unnamed protein product, partial [Bubo scandiacus]
GRKVREETDFCVGERFLCSHEGLGNGGVCLGKTSASALGSRACSSLVLQEHLAKGFRVTVPEQAFLSPVWCREPRLRGHPGTQPSPGSCSRSTHVPV